MTTAPASLDAIDVTASNTVVSAFTKIGSLGANLLSSMRSPFQMRIASPVL
jgi:hypothetical protein